MWKIWIKSVESVFLTPSATTHARIHTQTLTVYHPHMYAAIINANDSVYKHDISQFLFSTLMST